MPFPTDRPRRLRRTEAMRRLVRETDVLPRHLVQPFFVEEGRGVAKPIESMPGQTRHSPDTVADAAADCEALGIPAVLLFGIPRRKDARGSEAWNDKGVVQQAVREIKKRAPNLLVVHGTSDSIVPIAEGERRHAAAPTGAEFLRIDGADHNDLFDVAGDEYLRGLGERFRRWTKR